MAACCRALTLGIGSITVRQGAAPGELLTLASLFAASVGIGEHAGLVGGHASHDRAREK